MQWVHILPMDINQESMFDCAECNETVPSSSVPYDPLGYAICPACSYTTAPATEWNWAGD